MIKHPICVFQSSFIRISLNYFCFFRRLCASNRRPIFAAMAIPSDTKMDGDAALRLEDPPSEAVNTPQSHSELLLVQELRGHDDRVWSASWSPKGDLLASCSGDKTVRIWGRQGGPESQLICKVNTVLLVFLLSEPCLLVMD